LKISGKTGQKSILAVLFVGVLMGALDISIVGPAFPAIKADFGVDTRNLVWIFNIYLLSFLVGAPFMAKLSDRVGRRPIYILNISLFAIGSLITALSGNFYLLLIGRLIQGFGAGGIFPVASGFIGDTFPPEKLGAAFGTIGSVFGIAFILGPILAGVLLNFSWRWLFLINIPIAIILIVLTLIFLPKTGTKATSPFDYLGMAVLGTSLTLIAYGLNSIDVNNFMGSIMALKIPLIILAGLLLIVVLYFVEKRAEDPIIYVDLFKSRQFSLAMFLSLAIGLAQAGLVFIPSFAIIAFSLGVSAASFTLIPLVIATALGAPLFGFILDRRGSKLVILISSTILAVGLLSLTLFGSSNLIYFLITGVLIGLGFSGVLGAPLRYIVLNESPPSDRAASQGLLSVQTTFGQVIGGAILGALIASSGGLIGGYLMSYLFLAFLAVVMFIVALGLKNRAQELEGLKGKY
jgi:EmrB/QacA subfamily drug resistance transporter